MAISRKAARAFEKVERAITELRGVLEAEDDGFAEHSRWLRLLTMVEDAGGRVDEETWRAMGRKCRYDPRGLGGFYRGTNASMAVKGTKRVLTRSGKEALDQHGRVR